VSFFIRITLHLPLCNHSIRSASFSKYCPHTERTVENCGSPSLGFGKLLDFSVSFRPRHSVAWSAAFQIMFKNNEEFSIFELLRDVSSKRFHGSILRRLNDNG
jgi:hypothetical protein